MKCIHCGSEWSSTTSVTKCPFCGKSLSESTQKNRTLTSTLVEVRNLSGIQALSNGKALVSSFKDLAPTLKKEYTMLSYLEKCGGVTELFKVKDKSAAEQESAISKVVRRMADELMVSEGAAQSVCRAYMLVVSGREKEVQTEPKEDDASLDESRQKLAAKLKEITPAPKSVTPPPAKLVTSTSDANRAYHNEQPVAPPKPPVTPPKSPAAHHTAPVTPKPAVKKESSPIFKFLGFSMWIVWGLAYYFFFKGIEPLNTDGSFFWIIPISLGIHWWGRHLLKNDHIFWGFLIIFLSAGGLIMFFDFSPDSMINNIAQISYAILCAITSFCHGPIIFGRSK